MKSKAPQPQSAHVSALWHPENISKVVGIQKADIIIPSQLGSYEMLSDCDWQIWYFINCERPHFE